jgi:site-specific recombinase XerD
MKKIRSGDIVPMTYEDARLLFKKIIDRAGLQNRAYTLHSVRHGFALEIYRNTKDLMLVATLLGHKHLDATAVYVRLASVYRIREESIENPLDIALK